MSTTGNPPCVKNCGFFGSPATSNMCSSCYKKHLASQHLANQQPPQPPPLEVPSPAAASASAPAVATATPPLAPRSSSASPPPAVSPALPAATAAAAAAPSPIPSPPRREQKNRRRCFKCNKKVGFLGFECVCERIFCSEHRHAEQHDCDFDFRARQREQLARDNPTVKASKVNRL